jgi:hypothetical protein
MGELTLLALASHYLMLMYMAISYYHCIYCCTIMDILCFLISGGRPTLPVHLPAAISLLSLPLSPKVATSRATVDFYLSNK